SGSGTIQNLSIQGEVFPQAQVELASMGSKLDLRLNTGKNINLTAQLDTAATGYPFTAQAKFIQYPVQRLARIPATVTATGNVTLSGLLTDRTRLRGQGQIEAADLRLQDVPDVPLQTTKPFTIEFNSDRLNLIGVTLRGEATQVNVAGTIAFTEHTPVNLDVSGQLDLALLGVASREWKPGGSVNVQVALTGTPQMPDLRGVAHINNGSLRRAPFFASLTNVTGHLFFNRAQLHLSNFAGQDRGGTARKQGTVLLDRGNGKSTRLNSIHVS